MRSILFCVSLVLVIFLSILFASGPSVKPTVHRSIERKFNISEATPSHTLIKLDGLDGTTMSEILASGPVLSYRVFPDYWGFEVDSTYLCVAFGDDRFLDPARILSETLHGFTRGIIAFYEFETNLDIWNEGALIPRYVFVCADKLLGLDAFVLQGTDVHLCVVEATPSGNLNYSLLRKTSDGYLESVWREGTKTEMEIADIDNDLSKEIVTSDGIRVELFQGKIRPGLEAYIYRYLDGKYELVEIAPYDSRLAPRKLPDTPLPEDDFQ